MDTEILTPQQIKQSNREIMRQLQEARPGEVKFASDNGSKMLKARVYEEGFLRRILPEETVTDDDLTPQQHHELPCILKVMEPLSKGAKSVSFGDQPETESYRAPKYLCVFNPITTPDYTKDLNELRTYPGDLRQLITNNALIHMQTEEDSQFITTVNTIVGASNGNGAAGFRQHFAMGTGISRTSFPDLLKVMPSFNLNTGCLLMNFNTACEFAKWTRDQIGGDLAEKIFKMGPKAIETSEVLGMKIVITRKRAFVADGAVYLFAESNTLGHFMSLQAPTMTVKKERDFITFGARETVSLTLANVAAMAKATFTTTAFPTTVLPV